MVGQVDLWARGSGAEVFAQVGPTERKFRHIEAVPFLKPEEAMSRVVQARCIVAHAGMGTILSGLAARKPLLVVPRKASLGEHRNEHQLATARQLSERGLITVAWDEHELLERLDHLADLKVGPEVPPHATDELLDAVRGFLSY